MAAAAQPPKISQELKKDYLSYPEVLAQSVSVIAPSTAPAAILGLIFVSAGNGTWLSFLLATVGLLFVCFNINQFARRSASPGSLYTYIVKGLGPIAGVLSGWGLLLGIWSLGCPRFAGSGSLPICFSRSWGFISRWWRCSHSASLSPSACLQGY